MKNKKRVRKNKRVIGNTVLALMGVIIVFALFLGLGLFCEWLIQDNGRYILGLVILGYILIRLFKKEFDL